MLIAHAAGVAVASAEISGEVSGHIRAPHRLRFEGISRPGCQISPANDHELNVYFADATLTVGGHSDSVSDLQLAVSLARSGDTESLAPVKGHRFINEVFLNLMAGGRDYTWSSISGQVTSTAAARSGTLRARLLPTGSPQLPAGLPKGAASAPVRITGSWAGCTPG